MGANQAQYVKNQREESSAYLTVSTLNYSGLNDSPYEFYEHRQEQQNIEETQLNHYFVKFCHQKNLNIQHPNFKWSFKDIDRVYRKERYSPLYNPNCGITQHRFVMNEHQFKNKWRQEYGKCESVNELFCSLIKKRKFDHIRKQLIEDDGNLQEGNNKNQGLNKNEDLNISEQLLLKEKQPNLNILQSLMKRDKKNGGQLGVNKQNLQKIKQKSLTDKKVSQTKPKQYIITQTSNKINLGEYQSTIEYVKNQMMEFDYLVFKSIVAHVYGEQLLNGMEQNSQQFCLRASKYINFQQKNFSKSYLNEDIKFTKLIQALFKFKIDILFLQNISERFLTNFSQQVGNYRIVYEHSSCSNCILINNNRFTEPVHFMKPNCEFLRLEEKIIRRKLKRDHSNKGLNSTQLQNKVKDYLRAVLRILNLNGHTIIQFIDRLILISTHLTSDCKPKSKQKSSGDMICNNQVQGKILEQDPEPNAFVYENKDIHEQFRHLFLDATEKINRDLKFKSENYKQLALLKICLQFLKGRFSCYHIILGGTLNQENIDWYSSSDSVESIYQSTENDKERFLKYCYFADQQQSSSSDQQNLKKEDEIKFKKFHIFPQNEITSFQERTSMQAQANKARSVQSKSTQFTGKRKDYLITDLQLIQSSVITIDGCVISPPKYQEGHNTQQLSQQALINTIFQKYMNQISNNYPLMPNQKHPFGGYLVIGKFPYSNNNHKQDSESDSDSNSSNSSSQN